MSEKIVGAWNRKQVTWSKTALDTGLRDLCTASVRKTGSSNLRLTTSLCPWVGQEKSVKTYLSRDDNCKIKHQYPLCHLCQLIWALLLKKNLIQSFALLAYENSTLNAIHRILHNFLTHMGIGRCCKRKKPDSIIISLRKLN